MMNWESKKLFVGLLLLFSFIVGCDEHNDPRKNVELESSEIPSLKYTRLDSIVFHTPQDAAFSTLLQQLPNNISCLYVGDIMRMGDCKDSATWQILREFARFKDMKDLQAAIEKQHTHEEVVSYNNQLAEAIERLKKQLTKEKTPELVYMNGGLSAASYAKDQTLFIGLDYYLYPDPLVNEFPNDRFPLYKKKNMQSYYLVPNAIFNWLSYRYNSYDSLPPEKNDFLSSLIYAGKIMYAMDVVLPEVADSTKMMWSQQEWEWARENELNIWKEMAHQDVMFGTRKEEIHKWFNEAPFTNAGNLPQKSSPQLGLWMGWKIVAAYMEKNPSITIEQLWKERNNQKILSAFKPKI